MQRFQLCNRYKIKQTLFCHVVRISDLSDMHTIFVRLVKPFQRTLTTNITTREFYILDVDHDSWVYYKENVITVKFFTPQLGIFCENRAACREGIYCGTLLVHNYNSYRLYKGLMLTQFFVKQSTLLWVERRNKRQSRLGKRAKINAFSWFVLSASVSIEMVTSSYC